MHTRASAALSRFNLKLRLQTGVVAEARAPSDRAPNRWLVLVLPRSADRALRHDGLVIRAKAKQVLDDATCGAIASAVSAGRASLVECWSFDHAAAVYRDLAQRAGYRVAEQLA